jgi:A/G-specific adenine glycosylase
VNQGLPYYNKFTEKYPKVTDLAAAPEGEVLALWQGLGYYSRARNLLKTAQIVCNEHGGIFPKSFDGLIQLKGIGRYTAAAIASFAYNEKVAVVDGNVLRVLARYFGISDPVDTEKAKNQFFDIANELISGSDPATHNQAIMELGALVCLPKNAKCAECPLSETCVALSEKKVDLLPIKGKKKAVKDRYFQYFVYLYNGTVGLQKREKSDIWQNLYDFPHVESGPFEKNGLSPEPFAGLPFDNISEKYKHVLTHQRIFVVFCQISLDDVNIKNCIESELGLLFVPFEEVDKVAKPILIKNYLDKEILSLTFPIHVKQLKLWQV